MIMKRKWGQHFLVRERYVQRMIELAGVQAGDKVLEIGPGRGVLTRALLEIGAFVRAVEIDPTLQGFLQQEFAGSSQFQLLCGDALELLIDELLPSSQPARIVANLPYNAATAIFFHLLPLERILEFLVLDGSVRGCSANLHYCRRGKIVRYTLSCRKSRI